MAYNRAGQTQNFYWDRSLSNVLGEGMCGHVYKGISKTTGEPVAVKTFKDSAQARSLELQTRELDVLRRVNHVNIVKLLAIEQEEDFGRNVIVLELCTGGSLAKNLEDPENAYGLEEDEYLLVLEHLTNGMKYLWENKIVHRDLKPGNIMKYVGEDGRSIYKLTDFDTARELPEGQEFLSLYGTEEYLHPHMYERAVLRREAGNGCSAIVDLWSIGVTLYHVATGCLPFKPYLLRRDAGTMYRITTEKKTGVISGHQIERNGPIYWSKRLPKDCLLSAGLKTLITPLLAGLMEVDKDICWDFGKFFAESKNILDRKRLHVFYVNNVFSLRVYLEQDKSYRDLQTSIMAQTMIRPEFQTLLYKDSTLLSVTGDESGCAIPTTCKLIPIILCDKQDNNIKLSWTLPSLHFKLFPNTVVKCVDEKIATYNCGVGYIYKRKIEALCQSLHLINSSVLTINQVVVSQLMCVSKENLQIQSIVRSLSNQFEMMKGFHKSCQAFLQCIMLNRHLNGTIQPIMNTVDEMETIYAQDLENFFKIGDRLMKLKPSICQLLGKRVENRSLIVDWEEKARHIPGIINIGRIDTTATNLINKLRVAYENLRVNQHHLPALNNKQAQEYQAVFLLTERLNMRERCKSISTLLRNEYQEVLMKLVADFSDWFKTAQIALIQPEILAEVMFLLRVELSACELHLNEVVKDFQSKLTTFTEGLGQVQINSELMSASKDYYNSIKKPSKKSMQKVSDYIRKQIQQQQALMEEVDKNLDICHQFEKFLSEIVPSAS